MYFIRVKKEKIFFLNYSAIRERNVEDIFFILCNKSRLYCIELKNILHKGNCFCKKSV